MFHKFFCFALPLGFALAGCTPEVGTGLSCSGENQEIRVATALPNTVDWNRSSDSSAVNYPVIQAMMRGLTQLDEHHHPVPDLAEHWDIEVDGQGHEVYTFYLKPDVRWSDGRTPHVAGDYEFAWKRALEHGNELNEFLDIFGAEEVQAARGTSRLPKALDALGVKAKDDYRLVVTLKAPTSYFLSRIAYTYTFYPAPSRLLSGKSEEEIHRYFDMPTNASPVVLGAYRIASWDRRTENSALKLVPNPEYPGSREAGVPKAIKIINVQPAPLGPMLFQRCAVDMISLDDPESLGHYQPERADLLSIYWLGLNSAKLDLPLRKAISLAIDREQVLKGLSLPQIRPAFGLLPPDLPGAVAANDPLAADFPRPDAVAAWQYLKESSYHGEPLTLLVRAPGDGVFVPELPIADGIRQQLEKFGIHVRIAQTSNFGNDIKDGQGRTTAHLFLRRTGADYAHPQTFLAMFRADGTNRTEWKKLEDGKPIARYMALLAMAAAEWDSMRMKQAYTEAQRILLKDYAVVVPIYYPDRYYLKRPWIENLRIDTFNFFSLRHARVRPTGGEQ